MTRLFLCLLPFLWTSLARAEAPAYHWPLDTRPALTSTFGEYRNGRFHAGVDLKTWGQEGFPVRAVGDGHVARIRTSPWGYGRVIHQKLRDGRTALYAHLSGFAPRLAAPVEAEQDRKGFYSVDISFEAGQLPVQRGEVIGFSGSSGVGMPHLHFELRDEAERPINALEHGFSVADTLAPTIRALALIPLTPSALVNGGHDPKPFPASPVQTPVQIHGQIGVAADVFDQADASAAENRLAPYRLRLFVDGAEAFVATYSSFSYADNHLVDLDRNFALARRGAGRFHNLYRAKGNRLPLYGPYREGDGVLLAGVETDGHGIALEPGPHLLRVQAEDIHGNRSEAEVEVLADASPEMRGFQAATGRDTLPPPAEARETGGDSITCTPSLYPDFALLRVAAGRVLNAPPQVSAAWPNGREEALTVRQVAPLTFEAVLRFDPDASGGVTLAVNGQRALTLTQQTVTREAGGVIRSDDGMAEARFEPGRVYTPLFARAEPVRAEARPDLPLVGNAYRFTPDDVPFDGKASLTLRVPPGFDRPRRLGLYRRTDSGPWRFVDNRVDAEAGAVSGEVGAFSTFGLLLDETPPVIADLNPVDGSKGVDRQPLLSAVIRDAGSGIWREEDIALTLDGKRLMAVYDPDGELVAARPRKPLRPGKHRLEVTVRDICGNEARASSAFVVR